MGRVQQRRVLSARRLDVGPGDLRPAQLERDCDDLDPSGVQLRAQCLPPGQVEGAASVRCPRHQYNLLPSQRRQSERLTIEVIEHQFRGLGTDQSMIAE